MRSLNESPRIAYNFRIIFMTIITIKFCANNSWGAMGVDRDVGVDSRENYIQNKQQIA